ncbi:nuclear transport factor 2 family protein [Actinophytocola sp. KF-1]
MSAQNTDVVEKEIADLLDRWSEAELSGDPAAIGPFLDDDYVGIGPFGFTLTKAEWLQRHESGDLKYSQFRLVDPQVRQYGDTVLVIGVQDAVATYQGNPVPGGKLRFSATVVAGRIAGFQLSPMGPPPGMPQGGPRPS